MMQLKSGDAAFYHSAEYCRNYTSPPVSYGGSSHYLSQLAGKREIIMYYIMMLLVLMMSSTLPPEWPN